MGFNRNHTMKSDACTALLLSHRSCGIFRAALLQRIRPKLLTSSTNSPPTPKELCSLYGKNDHLDI